MGVTHTWSVIAELILLYKKKKTTYSPSYINIHISTSNMLLKSLATRLWTLYHFLSQLNDIDLVSMLISL